MAVLLQYRRSGALAPEHSGPRRTHPGRWLLLTVLCLAAGLNACTRPERPSIDGHYVTRDGLAHIRFLPERRFLFQHATLDISIEGEYHQADARKIYLKSPLRRGDGSATPPLLLRHRDELRLYKADGQVVHFYRKRDQRDGPEPLLGELDPPEESEDTDEEIEEEEES